MPKPSDIILARTLKLGGSKDNAITAIIDYLDEEWEKNKPCEHKNIITNPKGYDICQDCNVIGLLS